MCYTTIKILLLNTTVKNIAKYIEGRCSND